MKLLVWPLSPGHCSHFDSESPAGRSVSLSIVMSLNKYILPESGCWVPQSHFLMLPLVEEPAAVLGEEGTGEAGLVSMTARDAKPWDSGWRVEWQQLGLGSSIKCKPAEMKLAWHFLSVACHMPLLNNLTFSYSVSEGKRARIGSMC